MNDWEILLNQARKLSDSNTKWISLGGNVEYNFIQITPERIIIDRLSGGKPAIIGKMGAINAINHLKQVKQIYKTELINSVVRQTTLVLLHPNISYDNNTKLISWNENNTNIEDLKNYILQAKDDQISKIQVWINERKNQSKFKENLIKLYNGHCAISGTDILDLLQAAHIVSHAESRINNSGNGILLRSDLHILFDKNLLLINPENNKIIIHNSLHNTEYKKYNNLEILLPPECKNFLAIKWSKIKK